MPYNSDLLPIGAPTIVGVGASAGGLEAFTELLRCVPPDSGLAFVVIQHLDPTHLSLLSEVLAKATTMPVRQAEDGLRVEPNQVYVLPPNADIAVEADRLVLSTRPAGTKSHMAIDFFFRSLALERGGRAMGVVLSGAGADGTDGLRAIRAADGITFAQTPQTAKYPSMPQSAVDSGAVDHCLGIPELAAALVRVGSHPYLLQVDAGAPDTEGAVRADILARVRAATDMDFSEFKLSTVRRRLARRLALRGVADLQAYLELLDAEPAEAQALYEDMLVHVTSFFRDPEVFESLRTKVFPEILKYKPASSTVRVWVAGCSTGEEAYSLAIEYLDLSRDLSVRHPIQIFGSDASELAVQKARAGVYSESAMKDVSEERRKRYFVKTEGGYRVNKAVRDVCVFVRHDLVRDPPFSKVDLVSCRNVLIYFEQALQKKVLPTLHYCLNPSGFLVLGRSESISGFGQLFAVADKENKIFVRTATPSTLHLAPRSASDPFTLRREVGRTESPREHTPELARHLDRLLMARYGPAGVLVREDMEILLFRGKTGAYLQAAPGQPQSNLIGMARSGLVSVLREAIETAKQERVVVTRPGVEFDLEGTTKTCDVVVMPFSVPREGSESLFVVLFEEPAGGTRSVVEAKPALDPESELGQARRRCARLEHELASTKEYLHTLIEQHGRTNDELGASNEELISGNEELQSMNEELEAAKEELQSINEELTTLNDELQRRNQEVTRVNGDLLNFSLAVDVPILRLDKERRICRFTPKARSLLNVLPSDVGRSIEDIKLNIDVPDLNRRITEVIETNTAQETEVRDRNGHWHRMQVRPYTMPDHSIDGVVLSLVDIHGLKQLATDAEVARLEAERANKAKDEFLAMLSHELRTPLSSMLLNAQRLRSGDVVDPADLQRAGEALERSAWSQVRLIDDLLDVSRIVAGKLTLSCGPVDLADVVRAAMADVAGLVEEKSLAVRTSLEPSQGPIWADRARVQQVVSNLLTNAIRFTPKGGRITITVDMAEGFGRLRISDTGAGIDPAFLPHLFTRFSQADRSITRTHGGLGLGLALVRHLVELQGGVATAQSPGLGLGATFQVTFPMARISDRPSAEPGAANLRHALDRPGRTERYEPLAGLKILFIDDDQRTREAVYEVLKFTGAHIELASSAADGRAVVDRFRPQVILCDIAMPEEDGYTFMRKLRARQGDGAATPALALTALATEDDRKQAMAAGFQLHLAKPIDIDRLRDAVLDLAKLAVPAE